jgi:hypothetical protein
MLCELKKSRKDYYGSRPGSHSATWTVGIRIRFPRAAEFIKWKKPSKEHKIVGFFVCFYTMKDQRDCSLLPILMSRTFFPNRVVGLITQ